MTTQLNMDKVERARIILDATHNFDLLNALLDLGIDRTIIDEGRQLYARCDETQRAEAFASAAKQECARAARAKARSVRQQYSKLAQTARAIFGRDRIALGRIGLGALRRSTPIANAPAAIVDGPGYRIVHRATAAQSIFLSSARQLYDSMLTDPHILAQVQRFGYSEQRLRDERGEVTALEAFDAEQERLKGAAKAAVAQHRAAIAALQEWTSRFVGVVIPALSDRPELLDAMGLKPRGRTPAGASSRFAATPMQQGN